MTIFSKNFIKILGFWNFLLFEHKKTYNLCKIHIFQLVYIYKKCYYSLRVFKYFCTIDFIISYELCFRILSNCMFFE